MVRLREGHTCEAWWPWKVSDILSEIAGNEERKELYYSQADKYDKKIFHCFQNELTLHTANYFVH